MPISKFNNGLCAVTTRQDHHCEESVMRLFKSEEKIGIKNALGLDGRLYETGAVYWIHTEKASSTKSILPEC